ncbi:MAG TPA: HAD-IA family hydrolase [Afifellaceae bacterium]|nr:HAD-IA family hydrolase [Afifellaceae bacterium]
MILVLFDCDGTLVDSQHIIADAMDRTFVHHGFEPPGVERTRTVVGLSLPIAIAGLLDETDRHSAPEMAETYKGQFMALRSSPNLREPLFPGAMEVLDRLQRRDEVVIGMVTGKSRRGVRAVVEHHGLDGVFHVVRTADDCPSKPHPAMVLEACGETGIEPERAIVVGDTRFDMDMARAAGASPVGVSWGYHPVDALRESGAVAVLRQFDDLDGIVEGALDEIARAEIT